MLLIRGNAVLKSALRNNSCLRKSASNSAPSKYFLTRSFSENRTVREGSQTVNHSKDYSDAENQSGLQNVVQNTLSKMDVAKSAGAGLSTVLNKGMSKLMETELVQSVKEKAVAEVMYGMSHMGYEASRPMDRRSGAFFLDKFLNMETISMRHLQPLLENFNAAEMKWRMIPEDLQFKFMDLMIAMEPHMNEEQASQLLGTFKQMELKWTELPPSLQQGMLNTCFPVPALSAGSTKTNEQTLLENTEEEMKQIADSNIITTAESHKSTDASLASKTASSILPAIVAVDGTIAVPKIRMPAKERVKMPVFHNMSIFSLGQMGFDINTMVDNTTRERMYQQVSTMLQTCERYIEAEQTKVDRITRENDISREVATIMIGISTVGVKFDQLPQHLQVAVMRMVETVMHTVNREAMVMVLSSLDRLAVHWMDVPHTVRNNIENIIASDIRLHEPHQFRETLSALVSMGGKFDFLSSSLQHAIAENTGKRMVEMKGAEAYELMSNDFKHAIKLDQYVKTLPIHGGQLAETFQTLGKLQVHWLRFSREQWHSIEKALIAGMPQMTANQLIGVIQCLRVICVPYDKITADLKIALNECIKTLQADGQEEAAADLRKAVRELVENRLNSLGLSEAPDAASGSNNSNSNNSLSVLKGNDSMVAHLGSNLQKNIVFLQSILGMKIKWHEMESSFQTPVYHAINTAFSTEHMSHTHSDAEVSAIEASRDRLDLLLQTMTFLAKSGAIWVRLPEETTAALNTAIASYNTYSSIDLSDLLTSFVAMKVQWCAVDPKIRTIVSDSLVGVTDGGVSFGSSLESLLKMMANWHELLGYDVQRNTAFLGRFNDLHLNSHTNHEANLIPLCHALRVVFDPNTTTATAAAAATKEGASMTRDKQLLLLQTLSFLGRSGIEWAELPTDIQELFCDALHSSGELSSADVSTLLISVMSMDLKWDTLDEKLKFCITKAMQKETFYANMDSGSFCDTLHSLAELKTHWSDVNPTALRLKLAETVPNMSAKDIARVAESLCGLQLSWVDLKDSELKTALSKAVRTAAGELNLMAVIDLMHHYTLLTFDDPSFQELSQDSLDLGIHKDFMDKFWTLQQEDPTIQPNMNKKTAVYFNYLQNSTGKAGRFLFQTYWPSVVQTQAQSVHQNLKSSTVVGLVEQESNPMLAALSSVAPSAVFTVIENRSLIPKNAMPFGYIIAHHGEPVAFVDMNSKYRRAGDINATSSNSECGGAKVAEEEVLTRSEALKRHLYVKLYPNALIYQCKKSSTGNISKELEKIAREIVGRVVM